MTPSPVTKCRGFVLRALLCFGIVIALLDCLSCSNDGRPEPTQSDATAPAKVSDLLATALTDSSILLTWTAPGDDGVDGTAANYDLRFSTAPFPSAGHFPPSLPVVEGIPNPSLAGLPESLQVNGLSNHTTYYFGMRVADEAENRSPISNIAVATTPETMVVVPPDITPPATAQLVLGLVTNNSVSVSWIAPGDDGDIGRASRYELRYSTDFAVTVESWERADSVSVGPPQQAGKPEAARIESLPQDHFVSVALRTLDEAANASPVSSEVHAQTLLPGRLIVRADGSGDAPTIQSAIERATWGDTVLVEAGVYFENLHFQGRDIVLTSRSGYESTILDGSANGSVITLDHGESQACVIQGFTIRNGYFAPGTQAVSGAGVRARFAVPTIRENRIVANRSTWGGGIGMITEPGRAGVIERNIIEDNAASRLGGGISISGSVVIRDNVISRNTARFDAGGIIFFWGQGPSIVEGNSFYDNVAQDHGGAIAGGGYPSGRADPTGTVEIRNNLFVRNIGYGNDAPDPPDLGEVGGAIAIGGNVRIINNTFSANRGLSALPDSSGGAIGWWSPSRDDEVYIGWNIIEGSGGCGIAFPSPLTSYGNLQPAPKLTIDPNLFWLNSPKHVAGFRPDQQPLWTGRIVEANPQFCDPASGDYRVPPGSPAVDGPHPFGAFSLGGCGLSHR